MKPDSSAFGRESGSRSRSQWCPTFSIWQGLMIGIIVTLSVAPFYVLLLPRGMRPTFSFWQGLMIGILVTLSVAILWSTSSPPWDAPDLQLLAGVDDWHLRYVISCPFYDLLLLPRGMRPTFSFWQGLMIGILVTLSVALFMIYFFSHVGCARPSAFGRG